VQSIARAGGGVGRAGQNKTERRFRVKNNQWITLGFIVFFGGNTLARAAEPATYVQGTAYQAGDVVRVGGRSYQCKAWPYTPWCALSAYHPSGAHGALAWEPVGTSTTVHKQQTIAKPAPSTSEPSTPQTQVVVSPIQSSATSPGPNLSPDERLKIKNAISRLRTRPGVPSIDSAHPEKNPVNVQRVMKILTEKQWHYIFPIADSAYQYIEFLKAVAKFPALCGEIGQTQESCARELATIFAHANQETGAHFPSGIFPDRGIHTPIEEWRQGLYYMREMGCTEKGPGCEYTGGTCEANTWQGKTWPCSPGKKYYGRGAKQVSYNYNYGLFSDLMFNDVNVLLRDPDRMAREGWLAIASAIWFYMTPQSPKPSMHDVVVGLWKPNAADRAAGLEAGFGVTINIINGGVECGGRVEVQQAQNRIKYYQELARYFGFSPGQNLGCKGMQQFGGASSAAVNTYWEKDWSQEGACKLVAYQTPYTVFKRGDYPRCVKAHFGLSLGEDPTADLYSPNEKSL
jgi:chitodextrinase